MGAAVDNINIIIAAAAFNLRKYLINSLSP